MTIAVAVPGRCRLGWPVVACALGAPAVSLVAAVAWWLRSERRALPASYVVGLLSLPFLTWLVIAGWDSVALVLWRWRPGS